MICLYSLSCTCLFFSLGLCVSPFYMCVGQWCTTPGPGATPGPRRVVKWPAMSNRKRRLFKTGTDIKSAVHGVHNPFATWFLSHQSRLITKDEKEVVPTVSVLRKFDLI